MDRIEVKQLLQQMLKFDNRRTPDLDWEHDIRGFARSIGIDLEEEDSQGR